MPCSFFRSSQFRDIFCIYIFHIVFVCEHLFQFHGILRSEDLNTHEVLNESTTKHILVLACGCQEEPYKLIVRGILLGLGNFIALVTDEPIAVGTLINPLAVIKRHIVEDTILRDINLRDTALRDAILLGTILLVILVLAYNGIVIINMISIV
jgi:hypothetical protein